jgi:hypothetical protein
MFDSFWHVLCKVNICGIGNGSPGVADTYVYIYMLSCIESKKTLATSDKVGI